MGGVGGVRAHAMRVSVAGQQHHAIQQVWAPGIQALPRSLPGGSRNCNGGTGAGAQQGPSRAARW